MSGTSTIKRRGGRYPKKLHLQITAETKAAIANASNRYGVAEGYIGREALERGLKRTLNNLRKRAQQAEQEEPDA